MLDQSPKENAFWVHELTFNFEHRYWTDHYDQKWDRPKKTIFKYLCRFFLLKSLDYDGKFEKDKAAKCWRYEFEIHKGQHRLPTPRILAISKSKLCCCIKVSKVLMLTVWVGWLLNISLLHVHEFEKKINKNAHFDQRAKIALSWFQREIDLGWQFALN